MTKKRAVPRNAAAKAVSGSQPAVEPGGEPAEVVEVPGEGPARKVEVPDEEPAGEVVVPDGDPGAADEAADGTAADTEADTEEDPAEGNPFAAVATPDDSDADLLVALKRLNERRSRTRDLIIGSVGAVAGLVIGLIIGNATAGSGGSAPTVSAPGTLGDRGVLPDVPTQAPDATTAPGADAATSSAAAGTVTFVVTGSASKGVLITYGTNSTGSQSTKLPFSATMPLDDSGGVLYYDVYAQLHGSGTVTCSVEVNGKTIKSGTATTTSSICSAQISLNAATGEWQGV